MLQETHLYPSCCPYCHKVLDCASGLQKGSVPKAADLTVCLYCGGVCCFGPAPHYKLQRPTLEQVMNLPNETRKELFLAVSIVNSVKREKRHRNN